MIRLLLLLIVLGVVYRIPLQRVAKQYKTSHIVKKQYSDTIYSLSPVSVNDIKYKQTIAYINKYKRVALEEYSSKGLLPSITLAQGIIESNNGNSVLALKNKNHFGIKCFSRRCKRGHCSNFTDDSHKDFFLIFKKDEDSFREHSRLLTSARYSKLFLSKDYKWWAKTLKECGYATDPLYDTKLVGVIEKYQLFKLDNILK